MNRGMRLPETEPQPPRNVTEATKADPVGLRQRLARLSAAERARLIRRLGENKSEAEIPDASSAQTPAIRKCQPLRVSMDSGVAVYRASFSQQRMWFLHHYAKDSPVYCVPSAFHLRGPLQVRLLEAAFQAVIQRHDVLRTILAIENGELCQFVAPGSAFRLQVTNLDHIPAEARPAAAERCLDAEACRLFDLTADPPFRAMVVCLQPTEHVLLLVLHHIISDGWSRSNFYRELSAAYAALAAGQSPASRALPAQFADYSAWQKDWLQGGVMAAQASYWKTKLANEPEPVDLPSDRPRPATESFHGGRCTEQLSPELTAALRSRAQEEGATLFMILLAAFKALLHRYTGRSDLIVGVPVANRQHLELEELIGYFANTLVMRTTLPPGLTFRELLRRVRDTAVEAYTHQDMPFEQLVEMLQVRRDASSTPLFQVSFAVQDFPAVELTLPGVEATPKFVSTRTAKFDLSLTLERSGEGWTAATEHNTDLFDADRMQRMLGHWRIILESIAANPDQHVSEISCLTPAEQQQIVLDWNRTERDHPHDKCVHELFEEQAKRTPDAMAVEFEGNRMTYGKLDSRANRLAMHLRALGVGPDVLVGLCLERSLDLVAAMLGILKAGGAYVPLDPKYPKERIEFILQDAGASVLVTQRSLDFGTGDVHRVYMDAAAPGNKSERSGTPPRNTLTPANLAYVIYTSGSTGKPKGVAIEHRSVVSFLRWIREAFSDTELSAVLASTSICFDLSVFEICGPLSWGGRVLLTRNLLDLGTARAPRNVSLINTVPSVLAELFRENSLPPSIRTVCLAGEALRQPLVETIFKKSSAERVYDLYGPTETTVYSTWARRKAGGVENVGRPLANTQVYILDAYGLPVPVGIPGELYIGGAGLARGYWRRPGLTAERFVPDRFSDSPDARLFKTGDRARWLADGNVALLGRADGQVKLRGFRIELGEIETVLQAAPDVSEAAVILREDAPGNQRLVAYLASHSGKKPDVLSLRARLAATLPDYMVPGAFVWLDRLPLTPNGKIDRKALPAPKTGSSSQAGNSAQPVSLLELELIRLWQQLFQRESISRNDNFFELGGHSILAMRLTTEIEKLAGRCIPIAALFQAPTIAALARKLEDGNWVPPRNSLVPLQVMGSKLPVFCIHGMHGDVYHFIDLARELAPDRPVYGLQAVGLDGRHARHKTVEEMAAHYAREIRSVHPGPYHLAGISLGGWIAYAVAHELTRQGSKVASLAVLDTRATANVPWATYTRVMAPQLASRMRFHLAQLLTGPKQGRLQYLNQKLTWFKLYLTRARKNLPLRPLTEKLSLANAHDFEIDYYDSLVAQYRPPQYAGNVTVFAGEDAKHFHHATFWKQFVSGRVQINSVPGGHGSMIHANHVAEFAAVFKPALLEAETNSVWPPNP